MKIVTGKFNTAKIFTDNVELGVEEQILGICNRAPFSDSKIRIMPDAHSGKGCTIGTTMTITDKVVPSHVGVDIGCSVSAYRLSKGRIVDLDMLDNVIREEIPSSFSCRKMALKTALDFPFEDLVCFNAINYDRAVCSIGTLGGGNHFIEIDVDDEGNYWLVIHTGSRNLGTCVANYYQDIAIKECNTLVAEAVKKERERIKEEFVNAGRQSEIGEAFAKLVWEPLEDAYCFVQGTSFENYINDMKITQRYALENHEAIAKQIMYYMGWEYTEKIVTQHNYIDMDKMILRKGAVSALEGQRLLIPLNMRDGTLLCVGKGNEDWNYSAPHGAGRLMSRSKAKNTLKMGQFIESMQGITSSTVCEDTLDEAPMAYKPFEEIMGYIEPTVTIIGRMKPVYNFKAAE